MRTWTEIVKPYPELVTNKYYKVQVKDISRVARPKGLSVDLEFLATPQQGRQLSAFLSRPIRPHSLAAGFFCACHLTVTPEAEITPRDAINSVIVVRFERTVDGQDWHPVSFMSTTQGDNDGPLLQP